MTRPARHRNLGGDVPWFAAGLVIVGGVIATVTHVLVDVLIHRHRAPGSGRT